MTVGRLLSELDEFGGIEELLELMAFEDMEPAGFEIENFRAGVIASTVANGIPREKGSRAFQPQDFYPRLVKVETDEQLKRQLEAKRAGKQIETEVRIGNRAATPAEAAQIRANLAKQTPPRKVKQS